MDTLDHEVTYHFYNTMTGAWAGSIPLRGVTYGDSLNQVGSFSGNLDITDPSIYDTNWKDFTLPTYNSLIVDIDGDPHWGGIVCGRTWSFGPDGYQMNISGQTFWGWLSQIVQATDYSAPPYSGITGIGSGVQMPLWNAANLSTSGDNPQPYLWDPMLIAAQILADSLTDPLYQGIMGSLSIDLNGYTATLGNQGAQYLASGTQTPSDNYISINFPYTSLQTLQAMLLQLTQLGFGVGFDCSVDLAYKTPGNPYSGAVAYFNLDYPFRGNGSGARPEFEHPLATLDFTKALSYTFPEDGTSQAITVYETGGNQDIFVIQNVYAFDSGYPNVSRVFNIANMNSPLVTLLLQKNANSDMVLYSYPPVAPTVTYDLFDPVAGYGGSNYFAGLVNKGDMVGVHVPSAYATADGTRGFDPRFPTGLGPDGSGYTVWRAVTYACTVSDEGQSTIEWTLGTPTHR
jgi:hypothetical protein